MNQIVDVIITALTAMKAGANSGLTDVSKTAITDGYGVLKERLARKFGTKSQVAQVVKDLEANPKSAEHQATLAQALIASQAEQDQEVLTRVGELLTVLQRAGLSLSTISLPTTQFNAPVSGGMFVTGQTVQIYNALPTSTPSDATPPSFLSKLVWNLPRSNPFFTGREGVLLSLHEALNADNSVILTHVPQAINGMGGVGKTQIAIEYAHRYIDEYETILWVKADGQENILTDFRGIAEKLDLLKKGKKSPAVVVKTVKNWLESNTKWLLIFDNADEIQAVHDFLPQSWSRGQHTLITTRDTAVGQIRATLVEINIMDEKEGSLFLLRRTNRLTSKSSLNDASKADRNGARDIVRALGGLPLALEQAGAFISIATKSLPEYLDLYRKRQIDLLKRSQDKPSDYPYTVATTWDLSFQHVNEANPAAIELLNLCAFLDPDAIPEEIIVGGASVLGPLLGPLSEQSKLDDLKEELLRFSLVQRNFHTKTLTIHRLVQAVIRYDMGEGKRQIWVERAIRMVYHAFPDRVNDRETWPQCQRCLPHALACAEFIKEYRLISLEAAQLLSQVGYYLRERAQYKEAENHLQQALTIGRRLDPEHLLDVAKFLTNLARLYFDQYRYAEAASFYEQVLAIDEQQLGPEDPEVAYTLNRLALTYWYEGKKTGEKSKYTQAEELYKRALRISEQKLGPEADLTFLILNNQALLYRSQGRYEEAIELNQYVLAVREKKSGSMNKEVAQSLQNLGVTYYEQGDQNKYEEAEKLLKRALEIRKELLSKEDLQISRSSNYLAQVYQAHGKNREAAPHFKQALDIIKEQLGSEAPETKSIAKNYHSLLQKLIPELGDDIIALEENFPDFQKTELSKVMRLYRGY